jgi:large subunit ribosomal protein L35
MPKMKTHKGTAKRFKVTGSGKIVRVKAYKGHILTKKNAKRKRRLNEQAKVSSADRKKVKRLLGK